MLTGIVVRAAPMASWFSGLTNFCSTSAAFSALSWPITSPCPQFTTPWEAEPAGSSDPSKPAEPAARAAEAVRTAGRERRWIDIVVSPPLGN